MNYFEGDRLGLLSTDTKPTAGIVAGQVCIETDTGKAFYYTGSTWAQLLALPTVPSTSGSQYYSPKYTTTVTLNWNNGNVQYIQLANGGQTFTFANPQDGGRYLLILKQPASGAAGTVTWPAAVSWSGGTAPTLTTVNNKVDIITFVYDATNSKFYAGYTLNY